MSVFLPKYRASDGAVRTSKVYWMEFRFQGQPIRESTGTRSITLAKKIQDKRRRDLEEGASGIRKRPQPRLFSVAAKEFLETKKVALAASSLTIEKTNLNHLNPRFGRLLICDIEPSDVTAYQQKRIEEGAAPGTINL